jgi:hypothetical protein
VYKAPLVTHIFILFILDFLVYKSQIPKVGSVGMLVYICTYIYLYIYEYNVHEGHLSFTFIILLIFVLLAYDSQRQKVGVVDMHKVRVLNHF